MLQDEKTEDIKSARQHLNQETQELKSSQDHFDFRHAKFLREVQKMQDIIDAGERKEIKKAEAIKAANGQLAAREKNPARKEEAAKQSALNERLQTSRVRAAPDQKQDDLRRLERELRGM